jgi:hypothetical protein
MPIPEGQANAARARAKNRPAIDPSSLSIVLESNPAACRMTQAKHTSTDDERLNQGSSLPAVRTVRMRSVAFFAPSFFMMLAR